MTRSRCGYCLIEDYGKSNKHTVKMEMITFAVASRLISTGKILQIAEMRSSSIDHFVHPHSIRCSRLQDRAQGQSRAVLISLRMLGLQGLIFC
jgi:hypothetical protein